MHRRNLVLIITLAIGLVLGACASPAGEPGASNGGGGGEPSAAALSSQGGGGSGGGGGDIPTISARTFTGGSAQVSVSGMFSIDQDVAINAAASYGDGAFTWLQFGDSGAETPNALITFGEGEAGVIVGLGSYSATGTSAECTWETDVTDTTISGTFSCTGLTGYNPDDGSLGMVDLEINFTADS
jgi:hypothetical protein